MEVFLDAKLLDERQLKEVEDEVKKTGEFFHQVMLDMKFTSKTIPCVPVVFSGELIGVIEVLNKSGDSGFTGEDKSASQGGITGTSITARCSTTSVSSTYRIIP